uniref:Beta-lactamase domain-containing protein n=1 Tax=Macrostomum lignano TaxID=282301 RepID=A0A1I8F6Y9_9PLAT
AEARELRRPAWPSCRRRPPAGLHGRLGKVPDRHVQRKWLDATVRAGRHKSLPPDHLPRVVVIGRSMSSRQDLRAELWPAGSASFTRGGRRAMRPGAGAVRNLNQRVELPPCRPPIEASGMRAAVRFVRPDAAVSTEAIPGCRCRARPPAAWWLGGTCPHHQQPRRPHGRADPSPSPSRSWPASTMRKSLTAHHPVRADACVRPGTVRNAFDPWCQHEPRPAANHIVAHADGTWPRGIKAAFSAERLWAYFAVVTGRAVQDESVKQLNDHEAGLAPFKDAASRPVKVTGGHWPRQSAGDSGALVAGVGRAQADSLKALIRRFNLETEWKPQLPRRRQCARRLSCLRRRGRPCWMRVIALSALPLSAGRRHFATAFSRSLLSQAWNLLLEAESAQIQAPEARAGAAADSLTSACALVERTCRGQCVPRGTLRAVRKAVRRPARRCGGDPCGAAHAPAERAEAVQAQPLDPKGRAALRVLQSALSRPGRRARRADMGLACRCSAALAATGCRDGGRAGAAAFASASLSPPTSPARQALLRQPIEARGEAAGAAVSKTRSCARPGRWSGADGCCGRAGTTATSAARNVYHYPGSACPTASRPCRRDVAQYFHRSAAMLDPNDSRWRQQAVNIEGAPDLSGPSADALTGLAAEPGRLTGVAARPQRPTWPKDIHSLRTGKESKLDRFQSRRSTRPTDAIEGDRKRRHFATTRPGGANEGSLSPIPAS